MITIERDENNKIIIPKGYYLLNKNDIIQEGDLVMTLSSKDWIKSKNIGLYANPFSPKIYIRSLGI